MDRFILTPGPTQCKPELLEELAKPVIHHRSFAFKSIYRETRDQLQEMMQLDQGEVVLLTASGTGAMESSIANFFSPQDKVLVISIGHFGHRFMELATAYGLSLIALDYPLKSTYDLEEVKKVINEHPDLKGVFITHHETSSGVVNQLEPIGELIKDRKDCLFIVDSISGFLVHPLKMSAWHIDCLLASSQKGFLIPPGLAIAGLSTKAIGLLERATLPRYYFDFRKYIKMHEIDEPPFTPNISLICAMKESCHYINEIGIDAFIDHHKQLRKYLEAKLMLQGYDVNEIAEENKGNVLVLLKLKDGMNAKAVQAALEAKGITVATGFGEYATTSLRIGIIGDIDETYIDRFMECFIEVSETL